MRFLARITFTAMGALSWVTAVTLAVHWADKAPAAEPIRLSQGPHLFIDDHLIQRSEGLLRTTHPPEKLPGPILAKAEPWHLQPLFFQKVIHDSQSGRFRMWYNIKNPGGQPHVCFGYAESEDGIRWTRPNLGLVSAAGSKDNNLIDAPQGHFGLFFVDEGPDSQDPQRRYKMAYYGPGLEVAFSADGRRFKKYAGNPVIAGSGEVIGDIIDGCWDPLRRQYLLGCKIEKSGYPGKPHYHAEGFRRTVGMSVSKDFVHWRKPWFIVLPDPNNGMEEFYGFQPMVRGNLYVGFLRVLRDDLPADEGGAVMGIGWTELITSRNGENWTRYQEPFIDRNHHPGTWDHAMAWVGDCVTVGDEEFIYYCGYSAGHKIGDRQNGLARLRKNGFVSRDAGSGGGRLLTPPLILDGTHITVNARVEGELRLRVTDQQGKPLSGFDWADCSPVQGDSLAHPVRWKEALADIQGRPVRLEFTFRNAQLYSFDLQQ